MDSFNENKVVSSFKLPSKVRWGYGASGYASSVFFLNIIFYGMYFFTDVVGIAPAVAGMIVSIGAIWDAITGPIIGIWSDSRDPAKGRRRPFLLWVSLPLTVFAFLSFFNPQFSNPSLTIAYFLFVVMAAYTFQNMVDVPYTALAAEMTTDYDERTSLNTRRNIFWSAAMLISCAFLLIVDFFAAATGGDYIKGFAIASLVCMSPIAVLLLITYFTTKGYESKVTTERKKGMSLKRSIIVAFQNKSYRFIVIVFTVSIIGQAINNMVTVYYYLNNLAQTFMATSLFILFSGATSFIDSGIAGWLANKFSKKIAWAVCMGSWSLSGLIFVLFFLGPDSPFWLIGLFVIFNALGLNTQYQLMYNMVPDCVEVDEFKTGERREGLYYGMLSFIQKIAAAITMAIIGFIIGVIGYDGMAEVQSPETIEGLKLLYGLGCSVFYSLSIFINIFNPMSRKRHKALVEAIELKNAGKPYTTEGFEELL